MSDPNTNVQRIIKLQAQIAQLQAQVDRLEQARKKAFWAGYEDARMNPHLANIQKAWERFNNGPQKGGITNATDIEQESE